MHVVGMQSPISACMLSHIWTQQTDPPEPTRPTSSPKVIRGIDHGWQAPCSNILHCPVGTTAAHTDNLVLNREERRLRIWSNYLYINTPWWNRRTSDAGSASERLQEVGMRQWSVNGVTEGFIFTDSLYVMWVFLFSVVVNWKRETRRQHEGFAEQANNQNLISICCSCWEGGKHFVACFMKQRRCSLWQKQLFSPQPFRYSLFQCSWNGWKHLNHSCCQIGMCTSARLWIMHIADTLQAFIYILYWQRGSLGRSLSVMFVNVRNRAAFEGHPPAS